MKLGKLPLGIAGAVVLLAMLATMASAGRISSTSSTWRTTIPELFITAPIEEVRCLLTLEGSLHSRTMAKTEGSLIGYITSAAISNPCAKGSATILRETLPWHTQYRSFTGALPEISAIGVSVLGLSFQTREAFGITCLATSTAQRPIVIEFSREKPTGALTSSRLTGRPLNNCGTESNILGFSNSLTVLNSATRITVTLI
jgi:hypothetical protein